MIKILELFGGIGAPRKALINLGVEHKSIDYVEFNEKAVRSYNAMFDNRYAAQDVRGYDLRPDILVHGSPCQDFSKSGKQYGGNVEDGTRSSLMFETIKIVENLGVWKPKVIIWENVPDALSPKLRSAFEHYLTDIDALGYTTSYQILDARDFGVPQLRKRLYAISLLGDEVFNFDKLSLEPMKDIKVLLENVEETQYIVDQPSMLKKIAEFNPVRKDEKFNRRFDVIESHSWTITTKQMRCPNAGIIKLSDGRYRYLTERECWRLMGFDDQDFELALEEHPSKPGKMNGTLYHQAGNSIVVQVLESIFKLLISGEYSGGMIQETLF